MNAELIQQLTEYADNPGYSHGDYADTMRQAAAALAERATQPAQDRCCDHDSDCAIHNAPAYPIGPCDCTLREKSSQEEAAEDKPTGCTHNCNQGRNCTCG